MKTTVETAKPRTPKELVRYIGGKGTYKGFSQLAAALEIALENEDHLLHVMTDIYEETAKRQNTTQSCIQKNLRKLVEVIWKGEGPRRLESLTGVYYPEPPTVGIFMDDLTNYLRKCTGEEKK